MGVWAVAVDAWDGSVLGAVTVYACRNTGSGGPYVSQGADTPADATFVPRLLAPYSRSTQMTADLSFGGLSLPETVFGPAFSGGSANNSGAIEIAIGDGGQVFTSLGWKAAPALATYDYAERNVTVYYSEDETAAFSTFGVLFSGVVASVSATVDVLSLYCQEKDWRLRKPIQIELFKGLGPALRLDGSDDLVSVTDADELDRDSGGWTFEVIAQRQGNSGDAAQWIVAKKDNWILQMDTSGNLTAHFTDSGDSRYSLTSTHVLSGTAWEHISVVWNSTLANSKMYVDGVDVSASYSTGSLTQDITQPFTWGAEAGGAANRAQVDIAQVRLWSDERTEAEIADNVFQLLTGTEAGLGGYWPVDEGVSSTVADDANSNDGTITGATWIHTLEGEEYLRGKPKPVSIGDVRNRLAILVDPADLIYQLHDSSVSSIDTVYVNRLPIDFDSVVGDVTDLFANDPTFSDEYITDISTGRIKLGMDYGNAVVTVDLIGDDTSSPVDKTPARVTERLLENYSDAAGALVSADFTALNSAIGASITAGIALGNDPVELISMLDPLLAPVTSVWWITRGGKITAAQVPIPEDETADETLTESGVDLGSMQMLYQGTPTWRVEVGTNRLWYVHRDGEIDATLDAEDFDRAQHEYEIAAIDDTTVQTNYAGARVREVFGAISGIAANELGWNGMLTQLERHLELLGELRYVFEVPCLKIDYARYLNDIVALDFSASGAFGIATAKNFLLVGIDESDVHQTLTLWG